MRTRIAAVMVAALTTITLTATATAPMASASTETSAPSATVAAPVDAPSRLRLPVNTKSKFIYSLNKKQRTMLKKWMKENETRKNTQILVYYAGKGKTAYLAADTADWANVMLTDAGFKTVYSEDHRFPDKAVRDGSIVLLMFMDS